MTTTTNTPTLTTTTSPLTTTTTTVTTSTPTTTFTPTTSTNHETTIAVTHAILQQSCVVSETFQFCDSVGSKGTKRDYTNLDDSSLTAEYCKNQCDNDGKCAVAEYFESNTPDSNGVSAHCVHYRSGNYMACAFDTSPNFDTEENYVFSFYNEDPCTK